MAIFLLIYRVIYNEKRRFKTLFFFRGRRGKGWIAFEAVLLDLSDYKRNILSQMKGGLKRPK